MEGIKPIIIIHGGAGTISKSTITKELAEKYKKELETILEKSSQLIKDGKSALDAVTEAVRLLEECPLFNAGRGSVFTSIGTHEMDAAIMDGSNLMAGTVAGVGCIRNPILAARAVMEKSNHVMMIGKGAESFIKENAPNVEIVDPSFFFTLTRHQQLLNAKKNDSIMVLDHNGDNKVDDNPNESADSSIGPPLNEKKYGTVGAVALDNYGNLAAATSTGGMTNKLIGRVGDSPIIGAGCYANNNTVAVSCTGTGEMFIRAVTAYNVSAAYEYGNLSLEKAADIALENTGKIGGDGGLIAVDRFGNFSMPFNTEGMYRGYQICSNNNPPISYLYGQNDQ